MSTPPAQPGWYPDPSGSGGARWWDGRQWAQQAAPGPGAVGTPTAETDGFAITSLILAVMGIPILPIVFGHMARTRIRESNGYKQGDGLALAGLIIGWITLAIIAIVVIGIIAFAVGTSGSTSSY